MQPEPVHRHDARKSQEGQQEASARKIAARAHGIILRVGRLTVAAERSNHG